MAIAYSKTAVGTNKKIDEDTVVVGKSVICNSSFTAGIWEGPIAIADGVGGNAAGDIASYEVCECLSKCKKVTLQDFKSINHTLFEMGQSNPFWRNMATTLSGIFVNTGSPVITMFHVGNTRIYALQANRYLKQLTEDDTTVNFLVKTGRLTEEEAEHYSGRNEITACLGGGNEKLLQMKIEYIPVEKYSMLLMTSDGIHDTLSIDEMEDAIEEGGDWMSAVCMLIDKAKAKGSTDDCTAIIVEL